jgi:hypothetical protein
MATAIFSLLPLGKDHILWEMIIKQTTPESNLVPVPLLADVAVSVV